MDLLTFEEFIDKEEFNKILNTFIDVLSIQNRYNKKTFNELMKLIKYI